ncbi:MAG TPA: hypothetical protein VGM15_03180 [Burkholderiaceae bacterium]|jgi:hypothetical protein
MHGCAYVEGGVACGKPATAPVEGRYLCTTHGYMLRLIQSAKESRALFIAALPYLPPELERRVNEHANNGLKHLIEESPFG